MTLNNLIDVRIRRNEIGWRVTTNFITSRIYIKNAEDISYDQLSLMRNSIVCT